jgi:hypothetical protein
LGVICIFYFFPSEKQNYLNSFYDDKLTKKQPTKMAAKKKTAKKAAKKAGKKKTAKKATKKKSSAKKRR